MEVEPQNAALPAARGAGVPTLTAAVTRATPAVTAGTVMDGTGHAGPLWQTKTQEWREKNDQSQDPHSEATSTPTSTSPSPRSRSARAPSSTTPALLQRLKGQHLGSTVAGDRGRVRSGRGTRR